MDLQAYIQDIPLMPKPYLLLLLQAGYAAIGYCQGGEIQKHKVIRKYMVRKKQGKAQLKHLNSKGKSRAGSRIRLANTVDFFEEINAKIAEWHVIDKVAHIFYSGTSDMLHLLYQSKVAASFDKKDPRLRKLPFFTDKPLFKVLAHANYLLRLGELIEVGDVEGYNFDFLDADDVIDW
ncbi:MAG: hypothetical protein JJT94_12730 [Bernardetiaceae bacterium]|nr:hypothetical protein [Bernardetiaceae bacterium]